MRIVVRPIETERPKYRPDLFPSFVFQLLQRHPGRTTLRQERQNLGFRIIRQIKNRRGVALAGVHRSSMIYGAKPFVQFHRRGNGSGDLVAPRSRQGANLFELGSGFLAPSPPFLEAGSGDAAVQNLDLCIRAVIGLVGQVADGKANIVRVRIPHQQGQEVIRHPFRHDFRLAFRRDAFRLPHGGIADFGRAGPDQFPRLRRHKHDLGRHAECHRRRRIGPVCHLAAAGHDIIELHQLARLFHANVGMHPEKPLRQILYALDIGRPGPVTGHDEQAGNQSQGTLAHRPAPHPADRHNALLSHLRRPPFRECDVNFRLQKGLKLRER